ncbi:hypothetical protein INH39_18115 [Massilia violaceinigra]|uniref:Zinc ribbon domain-containing protein n=1 Tax=Massilia violaceinigra TaxID=2045208 RepID=A0ABY4A007_9BURK|nr:hypothetical protein [Massilia violaceinigra]UOD27444.1 hypothetical protein INH39_18115 [Massilia violaceinigra]
MKSCTTCASPLCSDVKYCPFCGDGTTAQARANKPAARAAAPAAAPVAEAAAAAPRARRAPETAAAPAPAVPAARPGPAGPAVPAAAAGPAVAAREGVRGTPPSFPVPPAPVAPKKGGFGKWVVLAVIAAGLFLYFKNKPDQNEVACNAAFDAGNKALLAKDMAGARSQALLANGSCTGDLRNKAQSLQTALESAESASSGCLRSFRTIDSHLDDHKLASAREALNRLSSRCSAEPDAAQARGKLTAAVVATQAAQAILREALDANDVAAAKTAYARLLGLNRENPDLASLKKELAQSVAAAAEAAVAPAVAAAPEPAPARPAAPAPVRVQETARPSSPPPPSRKPETDSGAAVKAEMAGSFLREAETALSQKKFDAAKTYVESARRMDPNNPRLDSMLQRINDREHQVLQQESTLR